MNMEQAMDYIHNINWNWVSALPCLDREVELLHRIGDPQKKLKFIHIAGTNGKGSTAAMLASTLGVGVLFSAAAVFLYQSAITLLAGVLQPLLSDAIIAEMSAVGGLLIFAVGLNMQGVTKIRVGNLLPAIFVPMAYLPIQDWLQGLFH